MKFDKNLFNIVMQKFDLKKRERELNTIKLMEDLRDYRYYLSEILSFYPPNFDDSVGGWWSYYLLGISFWYVLKWYTICIQLDKNVYNLIKENKKLKIKITFYLNSNF